MFNGLVFVIKCFYIFSKVFVNIHMYFGVIFHVLSKLSLYWTQQIIGCTTRRLIKLNLCRLDVIRLYIGNFLEFMVNIAIMPNLMTINHNSCMLSFSTCLIFSSFDYQYYTKRIFKINISHKIILIYKIIYVIIFMNEIFSYLNNM